MRELQQQRREHLERYVERKRDEEEWPGFNLRLPALTEHLWDQDMEPSRLVLAEAAAAAAERRSSAWPPPETTASTTVRSSFRLNPSAPAFVSSRASPPAPIGGGRQSPQIGTTTASVIAPTSEPLTATDPLGLIGSLFPSTDHHKTDIWCPSSSIAVDPEVAWAEAIIALSDEDDAKNGQNFIV